MQMVNASSLLTRIVAALQRGKGLSALEPECLKVCAGCGLSYAFETLSPRHQLEQSSRSDPPARNWYVEPVWRQHFNCTNGREQDWECSRWPLRQKRPNLAQPWQPRWHRTMPSLRSATQVSVTYRRVPSALREVSTALCVHPKIDARQGNGQTSRSCG